MNAAAGILMHYWPANGGFGCNTASGFTKQRFGNGYLGFITVYRLNA